MEDKLVICRHYLDCIFDCEHKTIHKFSNHYHYRHNCNKGCAWDDTQLSCINKTIVDRKKKITKLNDVNNVENW
jgi:hypothetical protein